MSASSNSSSDGMIRVIGWPIISSALQPKIRAAASFHEVTRPSSDLPTIASSERGDDRRQPRGGEVARVGGGLEHQLEHPGDPAVGVGEQGRAGDEGRPAAVGPLGEERPEPRRGPAVGEGARRRARRRVERPAGGVEAAAPRRSSAPRPGPGSGPRAPRRRHCGGPPAPAASVAKAATGRRSMNSRSAVMVLRRSRPRSRCAGPATREPARGFRRFRGRVPRAERRAGGWRRERDSNPRDGFPPTHFPGVRLRPLGHLSGSAGQTMSRPAPQGRRNPAFGASVNDSGMFSLIPDRAAAGGLSRAHVERNEKVDRPFGQDARGTR